jgi:hypothetical protein
MGQALFSNNAFSLLASGVNDAATSLTVTASDGALFPTITGSDYFYATLIDTSNNLEIVKCTARSTDTLTVVRGAESTTPRAYSAGDRIELRPTAAGLTDVVTTAAASAAAAATSETNAAASYDSFDDRYLGAKASAPTVDNDSNTLLDGALYFNTTSNDMWVYDLGNTVWVTVSNTATSVAAAASEAAAAASEAAAAASEAAAAASEAAAAASAAGIFWKEPVVVASTANLTLSGEQTIDGVLTSTSRVLVKNQAAPEQNGIYVTAAGAWARSAPLDTWDEHVGAAVIITQGATQADTSYLCTADPGGTLETTAITWTLFGSGGLTAGNNLSDVSSAVTAFANIKQAASTTATGVVELAIASELNTGTDAARAVTPDALAGSNYGTAVVPLIPFNSITACATGDHAGSITFRVPSILNGFNLVGVAAANNTAGTTGTMDIQVHNITQTADMLTTKITIDSGETDSSTAATAAVIDAANDDVATGDQIRVDVDAVQTTPATGLMVELQFRLP